MKKLILSGLFLAMPAAHGVITIDFNDAFNGGVSEGLANAAGTPTDGLVWGILIDTADDGTLHCYGELSAMNSLEPIRLTTDSGNTSDDILFLATNPTQDTSVLLEGDFATTGGPGGIDGFVTIEIPTGVSVGDSFSLVWFDNVDPTMAGILSDLSFIIPADGSSVTYGDPFLGPDSPRAATGLKFGLAIPEPSSTLLMMLGGLGLVAHRRK